MRELPAGWKWTKLSDVAAINPRPVRGIDDGTPVSFVPMPGISADGPDFLFSTERKFGDVRKGFTHFADGDVLFAKITPCMENGKGGVARNLINGIGFGTTELHVLRPDESLDANYLYRFMQQRSFRTAAEAAFTGSAGQARVPVEFIRSAEIPLPPIEEQRRIVDKLDEVLARVSACHQRLDKIPKLLARFRQAVLTAACSGQLTNRWASQNRCTSRSLTTIGEIAAELRTGPFGSALHKADYVTGQIPVVNPTHLISGLICPSASVTVTSTTQRRLADYMLVPGDIVIARRGEMGRCAVVTERESGWLCGTGCVVLRLRPRALPHYVEIAISSPESRAYLSESSVGTTMENLNQKLFAAMPLMLPDVDEQAQIIREVRQLFSLADRLEVRVKAAQNRIGGFTQSILSRAFRGGLVSTEAEPGGTWREQS